MHGFYTGKIERGEGRLVVSDSQADERNPSLLSLVVCIVVIVKRVDQFGVYSTEQFRGG
jgi:hypothetical protein